MSRLLSQALGASEPLFSIMVADLERATGNHGIDVRLTASILQKAHVHMRELGLDPSDTTGRELYAALMSLIKLHDEFLTSHLGIKNSHNLSEVTEVIEHVVSRMNIPKAAWVVKYSVAKRLIKAMPPKQAMKALGYRSVDSMLKREPVSEILCAIRLVETPQWQQNFLAKYSSLTPRDFEIRRIEVIRLDPKKWTKASEAFVHQKRHNVMHLKELGTVQLLPMPISHMRGATMAMLPLVLHYINEIRVYSSYFKMQQVQSEFGTILARTLSSDPSDHATIARQPIHWRVIQRYYGLHAETHPEVFEPHVLPEDVMWRKAEDVLYRFEPALNFWRGMEYVGFMTKDGPVSFNLMDLAISYANGLPFEKRSIGHFRSALSNELFTRYLGHPVIEGQVLRQLRSEVAEPGLLIPSMEGIF